MTALDAMRSFPQWVNYRLVPKTDGKTDKLPVNPLTGQVCNAHDPSVWCDYVTAYNTGAPVAFVFAQSDPFFFLDIDGCLEPSGNWNEQALYLCSLFPGCAVEVSQSGRGLHIFGMMPADLQHSCKRPDLGLEFYTTGRFCAITEAGVTGDAAVMPDPETYRQFVSYFFPPSAGAPALPGANAAEWTTEPCAEYLGPESDEDLIERMLRSRSVKSIVGAGVRFRDLWNADGDALSQVYPDNAGIQGRAFDWSAADAALCSHLAFWTGKNCERMDRLWGQSALGQREKYHTRPPYRRDTILRAVAVCSKVYRDRKLIQPADPDAPPDADGMRQGFQFLAPQDQSKLFVGCVYVRDAHRVFVPDGGLLKPDQFKATYGGYVFALDNINDKTTRNAYDAFIESQAFTPPRVNSTCFRPEHAAGEILQSEGRTFVNTYVPVETECLSGDPAPFLDLVGRLLPDDRDRTILLSYMAACVQYPGIKFQWAPVLQGTFGNGKSLLTEILSYCVGIRYTHKVNPKDLDNVFNAWITGKLLIIIDEVKVKSSDTAIETLKSLVTDSRLPIQAKGRDQETGDNRANLMLCTNYRDGIVKTRSDRRFSVFFTAQQCVDDIRASGMGGRYFPNFVGWLKSGGYSVVNYYLRTYTISDELNPATTCVWAPETTSSEEAITASYGPFSQEIIEAVESGTPGFCGGWVSSMALDRLVSKVGARVSIRARKELLAELGYVKHPSLPDGRVTRIIPAENGRPRLYVKSGHLSLNIHEPGAVAAAFCSAQCYPAIPESPSAQASR